MSDGEKPGSDGFLAYAAYDSDWHVYVDAPGGSLGYCTGTGPGERFDPSRAAAVLRDGGWTVTGQWSESDGEFPYTARVTR